MTDKKINDYILANYQKVLDKTMTRREIAKHCSISEEALRKRWQRMKLPPIRESIQNKALSPEAELARDIRLGHMSKDKSQREKKYRILQAQNDDLLAQVSLIKRAEEITTYQIKAKPSSTGEATAVVLASDFHSEELVRGESVSGLNEFNLTLSEKRIKLFFQNIVRLIKDKQEATKIRTLVLALLGDFITGKIHEEIETLLDPAEAVVNIQNHLASGIKHLLQNTDVDILLPCHSGNHGRQTKTTHQGAEHANSNEYLMYHMLANHFAKEKRVKFLIAKGYHSYMDICGFKIRFHHGHNIKYGGGVGGITIPTAKAIAQWNKANNVDLDCFGHFHQLRFGGNFICNGSLIGYNAFALAIKADYEKPKQAFFLVNHKRKEVADFNPIWLD